MVNRQPNYQKSYYEMPEGKVVLWTHMAMSWTSYSQRGHILTFKFSSLFSHNKNWSFYLIKVNVFFTSWPTSLGQDMNESTSLPWLLQSFPTIFHFLKLKKLKFRGYYNFHLDSIFGGTFVVLGAVVGNYCSGDLNNGNI